MDGCCKRHAKAIEMLDQLSIFFRIGLSKGLDWISVREDIEHLYSYLYIQRVRYSDLLDFTVDVDEGMMECMMLKLTFSQSLKCNLSWHSAQERRRQNNRDGPHGRRGRAGIPNFGYRRGDEPGGEQHSAQCTKRTRGKRACQRIPGFSTWTAALNCIVGIITVLPWRARKELEQP